MEQNSKENAGGKDEVLWVTAKNMAEGTLIYRSIWYGSFAIAGIFLAFFILWAYAKQWTWQDVVANIAIVFLAWGAMVAVVDKVFIKKNEAIALSQLSNISVIRLSGIILERGLARISMGFLLGGLIAEVANFCLQRFNAS